MNFLILNITALFSLVTVASSAVELLNNQCPTFNFFKYFSLRQCPVSVGADLKCVVGLPGDVYVSGVLNCATVDEYTNASLQLLDPSEMLALIRYRDVYGRPWCMLSLLYSPDCVFSAKIASIIFRVAPFFPKLKVVAVDISTYSRNADGLVAQYGVASTPMVTLWENGYSVFRLYDDAQAKLHALIRTIRVKTDLTPIKNEIDHRNSSSLFSLEPMNNDVDDENYRVSENGTITNNGQNEKNNDKELIINNESEGSSEPDDLKIANKDIISKREDINGVDNDEAEQRRKYPTEEEFLRRFRYLKSDVGFDWYFVAALVASLLNLSYFAISFPFMKQLLSNIRPMQFNNN